MTTETREVSGYVLQWLDDPDYGGPIPPECLVNRVRHLVEEYRAGYGVDGATATPIRGRLIALIEDYKERLRAILPKRFTAERVGPFHWRVRVEFRYGSNWVADFWRRSAAEAAADRLNRWDQEMVFLWNPAGGWNDPPFNPIDLMSGPDWDRM